MLEGSLIQVAIVRCWRLPLDAPALGWPTERSAAARSVTLSRSTTTRTKSAPRFKESDPGRRARWSRTLACLGATNEYLAEMSAREADEKPEERLVRALLEREFSSILVRVHTASSPRADYRTSDDTRGIEIKRLTGPEYLELGAAGGKSRSFNSTRLTGRWQVAIERPSLSDRLAPVPNYPVDDPARIAEIEADGHFRVRRRDERVAEWRAEHPGTPKPTPRLRSLGRDLEPHLVLLERHGVDSTRGLSPFGLPDELTQAAAAIATRTHGAICLRHDVAGLAPGVDTFLSTGYVRTDRADTSSSGSISGWTAARARTFGSLSRTRANVNDMPSSCSMLRPSRSTRQPLIRASPSARPWICSFRMRSMCCGFCSVRCCADSLPSRAGTANRRRVTDGGGTGHLRVHNSSR